METLFLALEAALRDVATSWQFLFLTSHILINFIVAVIVALYAGTFKWDKLHEVVTDKVIIFVGVYIVGSLAPKLGLDLSFIPAEYAPGAVFAVLEASLFAALLDNLYKLPYLKTVLDNLPDGFLNTIIKDYQDKLKNVSDNLKGA